MKLIDSHCHLDFEPLSEDIDGAVERAGRAGVGKIINIGTSLHRSRRSVELANYYSNVWASVGLHPQDVNDITILDDAITELKTLAQEEKVVSIGEIGLDYYRANGETGTVNREIREKQKELLKAQIELAQKLDLPIIFHVRDAWDDFFEVIRNSKFVIQNSSASAVVHCFTGDEKIAQKLVKMGFYIGFTGLVTFKNANTSGIKEAAKVVPLEKILIETDAPFLAPEPYRGKTNEPAYVLEVAKKIAEIKEVSLEEVAKVTTNNAEKFFSI